MFRFILPIILVGVSISGFFTLTSPFYKDMSLDKEQIASYNEALDNARALEAERDKLTQKYNSFKTEDLAKLNKFLPDSVDNIRLILEIEKIALPYGMVLKDVRYDAATKSDVVVAGVTQKNRNSSVKDFGVWNLGFSTTGTYDNFLSFVKDLENNLRIVDISSIQFSSNTNTGIGSSSNSYKYNFNIKTYWLKN